MKSAASLVCRVLFFALPILFQNVVIADMQVDQESVLIEKIKATLPSEWTVAETKTDVIPDGHYWGLEYDGKKGLLIVLQGKIDIAVRWKGEDGVWHQESIAKEALWLWLMPLNYEESWRQFFVMKRPKPAKLLFSGREVKIYSRLGHRIVNDERFREIVTTKSIRWPDSPATTEILSWKSWREDIHRAFAN